MRNSSRLAQRITEEDRIREKYSRRRSGDMRYSWFNPGHVFMVQERERHFLQLLKRIGMESLHDTRILEIGCGDGLWLREFIKWGAQPANVTGIDLLPERTERAQLLSPQKVGVLCGSAAELPFYNRTFDLVLQSTVFTSIQDRTLKQRVAAEMLRVLRPGGLILWYDFRVNNPRNPDVTGVPKREIFDLFPECRIELHPMTLIPPLARNAARWSWLTCYLLGRIPWLCTHYLGVIRKDTAPGC